MNEERARTERDRLRGLEDRLTRGALIFLIAILLLGSIPVAQLQAWIYRSFIVRGFWQGCLIFVIGGLVAGLVRRVRGQGVRSRSGLILAVLLLLPLNPFSLVFHLLFAYYQAYADDLLERMANPFLQDNVERVVRDPRRKLAWDDRLIGTMRLALAAGVLPWRFARGAALAWKTLQQEPAAPPALDQLWPPSSLQDPARPELLELMQAQARASVD